MSNALVRIEDNEPVETVLVVDDEPIVRDVVVRYLRHAGYEQVKKFSWDRSVEEVLQGYREVVR